MAAKQSDVDEIVAWYLEDIVPKLGNHNANDVWVTFDTLPTLSRQALETARTALEAILNAPDIASAALKPPRFRPFRSKARQPIFHQATTNDPLNGAIIDDLFVEPRADLWSHDAESAWVEAERAFQALITPAHVRCMRQRHAALQSFIDGEPLSMSSLVDRLARALDALDGCRSSWVRDAEPGYRRASDDDEPLTMATYERQISQFTQRFDVGILLPVPQDESSWSLRMGIRSVPVHPVGVTTTWIIEYPSTRRPLSYLLHDVVHASWDTAADFYVYGFSARRGGVMATPDGHAWDKYVATGWDVPMELEWTFTELLPTASLQAYWRCRHELWTSALRHPDNWRQPSGKFEDVETESAAAKLHDNDATKLIIAGQCGDTVLPLPDGAHFPGRYLLRRPHPASEIVVAPTRNAGGAPPQVFFRPSRQVVREELTNATKIMHNHLKGMVKDFPVPVEAL